MTHLAPSTLVDYWTRDLSPPEVDDVEAHLFACDACAAEAERIAKIATALHGWLPPAISTDELAKVRTSGLVVEENTYVPGVRATVTFNANVDMMIHHLSGLDLAGAERVELTVRSESGGTLHHDPVVPFDVTRGEILIACQRHFAALPADVVFDVAVHGAGAPSVSTYELPHVFVVSPPAPSA